VSLYLYLYVFVSLCLIIFSNEEGNGRTCWKTSSPLPMRSHNPSTTFPSASVLIYSIYSIYCIAFSFYYLSYVSLPCVHLAHPAECVDGHVHYAVASLVQVIDDSFFRTHFGFATLVERVWSAMGYTFDGMWERNWQSWLIDFNSFHFFSFHFLSFHFTCVVFMFSFRTFSFHFVLTFRAQWVIQSCAVSDCFLLLSA
jgi:hypothetical protein